MCSTRIRKFIIATLIFLGMLFFDLAGQTGQVFYYMNLPQNHIMNPAFRPSNSLYIGLPGLTGLNMTVNNNFINFTDLFIQDQASDSVISFLHPDYDIDNFIAKLNDKNSISPQATVQLLGVGFAAGKDGYFSLDVIDRIEGNLVLPGDLLKLMLKGNEQFVGNEIDLSSFRMDMRYYREIGFGYSRNYRKLRLGVRGKFLFGIAGISTVNNALGITVNEDYSHTLNADLSINISAPVTVYMDENNNIDSIEVDDSRFDSRKAARKYFLGTDNFGLGLDMGAAYEFSDRIQVSAAITDIGYIKWKRDVTNLKAESQFDFNGLSMVDVLKGDKTFDEVGDEMLDSLKNSFVVSQTSNPFTTWLPVGVTLGGNYKLTKDLSFGVLSYSRIIGKQVREALTFSANVNFGSYFSTSVGYTLANHRADNIGAGVAFRAGVFQLYFVADRIPMGWNRIGGDNPFILPSNWNTISARVGMNLVFGNTIGRKKDIPMISVQ